MLFVTPGCFDKGGISRYSRYQISALRQLVGPHRVRVLSLLGPDADSFEDAFTANWCAGGAAAGHKLRFALRTLTEAVRWRPHVIHCAHVNLSGLAALAARAVGARTALNTYGLEVWSGLSFDARRGLSAADQVVSDCHFTATYLEEEGLRPRGSTRVIWDCVDLERFRPGPIDAAVLQRYALPDPAQHFVLLTLGRLARAAAHKGYERLLDVVARLAPAFPSLRLVIAGRGDLRPDLEQRVSVLGLQGRVVFAGPVAEEDLPAVYRAAHAFSLVSDRGPGRGEGIPLTPLEAMACGLPVLVGNQDGSQEAVVEGRNGIVLDPFDAAAHAVAIADLIASPEKVVALSAGAVEVARELFSYGRFVEQHRSLYGLEVRPQTKAAQ